MELNDTRFVPALQRGFLTVTKYDQRIFNKTANWWEAHSIAPYGNLLMSYFLNMQAKTEYLNIRERYRIPKSVEVFADSGAYGAIARGYKFDPAKVFDWQRRNGDVAFILDDIPEEVSIASSAGKRNVRKLDSDEFKLCAENTYRNCEIIFNMRGTDKRPRIYGVVHGVPEVNLISGEHDEKYDYWFDKLKDFPFDGWGTGFRPPENPLLQALALMKIREKGVTKNVHLLGVGAAKTIPTIIWASQYFEGNVTFDSTRYGGGATSRIFFYPEQISKLNYWTPKVKSQDYRSIFADYLNGNVKCDCIVCQEVIENTGGLEFYAAPGSFPGLLLSLHNLQVHFKVIEKYKTLLGDKESFLNLAKQHNELDGYRQVVNAIEFIEECVKYGVDKSLKKYIGAGMKIKAKRETQPESLFDVPLGASLKP